MGPSIWQLLIVLVIVLLIFGTKRLRSLGTDLGGAVKGFKGAMNKDGAESEDEDPDKLAKGEDAEVVDAKVADKDHDRV